LTGRRVAFWLAVGGVSIASNFLVAVVAAKHPDSGLGKFVAFKNGA